MIWCLLLLLGGYLTRRSGGSFQWFKSEKMDRLYGTDFEDVRLPNALRDDFFEKSFPARSQHNIRLPHGPNPQVKHVENFRFFDDDRFRNRYQMNLHEMQVENQDWRLDDTTFGVLNSYMKNHNPENSYGKIGQFSKLRRGTADPAGLFASSSVCVY